MFTLDAHLTALPSPDLLAALDRTAAQGRELTADLIALLAECDTRQLYAEAGYASLFEFCVARLCLSEAQAYHRIQAARAVRRFPVVLDRLRQGRVTLTAVALLREHLTDQNHREVLDWAEGRGKREVEAFIRRLDPRPDVAPSIRRLVPARALPPAAVAAEHHAPTPLLGLAAPTPLEPASRASVAASLPPQAPAGDTPPSRSAIHPLAPARYSLRVTISEETQVKLRRAQDLLRHALPTADAALVLDRALTLLVAQLERRKAGAAAKRPARRATSAPKTTRRPTTTRARTGRAVSPPPNSGATNAEATTGDVPACDGRSGGPPTAAPRNRPTIRSRYIPAAIRRAVWDREGGRCGYVAPDGRRCTATACLEYHHRVPFAEGGPSTADNVMLRCRRHNAVEARRWFNFDQAESRG